MLIRTAKRGRRREGKWGHTYICALEEVLRLCGSESLHRHTMAMQEYRADGFEADGSTFSTRPDDRQVTSTGVVFVLTSCRDRPIFGVCISLAGMASVFTLPRIAASAAPYADGSLETADLDPSRSQRTLALAKPQLVPVRTHGSFVKSVLAN